MRTTPLATSTTHAINQVINVNSFYFKEAVKSGAKAGRKDSTQVKAYPRRIQFGNTQYTFEDGLQCLIRKGQRVVRLFDMTDGRTRFRLKLENDEWTLLGTRIAGNSAPARRSNKLTVSMGV